MDRKRIRRVDTISELPDHILHHILSFIPFKEVGRTSILSKRWNRVWRSYPVLKFDELFFYSEYLEGCDLRNRRNRVFSIVERTLRIRHEDMISLIEFTLPLRLSADKEFRSFVNQCVRHALGCNVKKLKLIFDCSLEEQYRYNLPQIVLLANSLEILKLQGCKIELPKSDLNLFSLRKLTLASVYINDHMIRNLVRGCPLMERLNFTHCNGFKTVELLGLSRLYKVKLVSNTLMEKVEIKSKNVCLLTISGLKRAWEMNFASCQNLKRFTLAGASITDEWLHSLIPKLPMLEYLHICGCANLKTLRILSSCLQVLDLWEFDSVWTELKIDTPNLHSFKYWGTVKPVSLNAKRLSDINLHIYDHTETREYIEFLANFYPLSATLNSELQSYEVPTCF